MSKNELDLLFNFKTKNNLDKELDKTEKKADKTAKKVSDSFQKAFKTIAAAYAANVVKDQLVAQEKLSLGMKIIEAKNKDLALAMNNTSSASFGLVQKYDMVEAANKAMAFGIDLSNGKYEELVKTATKISVVMGTDVKSAFNDIIVAAGRQSKMIADNMGAIVDSKIANEAYAKTLGKTAKQLTNNEKKTAFLTEMMKQMKVTTMAVSDEMLISGTKIARSMKKIDETVQKVMMQFANWGASAIEAVEFVAEGFARGHLEEERYLQIVAAAQEQWMREMIDAGQRGKEYTKTVEEVEKALFAQEEQQQENIKLMKEERIEAEALAKTKLQLLKAYNMALAFGRKEWTAFTTDPKKQTSKRKPRGSFKSNAMNFSDDEAGKAETFDSDDYKLIIPHQEKKISAIRQAELDINMEFDEADKRRKDKIAQEEAARIAKSEQRQEMYYNALESFGRGFYTALLSDQENAIPIYLANQAMMFGQTLFWDGVKTLWMSKAENALFPGAGIAGMGVGATEMLMGGSLMALGGVASSALSGAGSSDSGATERSQSREQRVNIFAETSLYSNRKEAKRETINLIEGR